MLLLKFTNSIFSIFLQKNRFWLHFGYTSLHFGYTLIFRSKINRNIYIFLTKLILYRLNEKLNEGGQPFREIG